MPAMVTAGYSVTLSSASAGGDSGNGRGEYLPVIGSNPRLVPKSGCSRKELFGKDQDGSKVVC